MGRMQMQPQAEKPKLTDDERERLWREVISPMIHDFSAKDWVDEVEGWVGAEKVREWLEYEPEEE